MRNVRRYVAAALLIAVLAVVAIYVWPTAYRDVPIQPSNPRVFAAREHRFTRQVQLLTRAGWIDVPELAPVKDSAWDPLAGYNPNWRR